MRGGRGLEIQLCTDLAHRGRIAPLGHELGDVIVDLLLHFGQFFHGPLPPYRILFCIIAQQLQECNDRLSVFLVFFLPRSALTPTARLCKIGSNFYVTRYFYVCFLPRDRKLRRLARADGRGGHRRGAAKAAAHQGRARHGQDHAGAGRRRRAGQEAHHLEREIHHQGAGRSVRLRRRPASLRQPVRLRRRGRHRKIHQARQARRGVLLRRAGGAAHRRGGQGRS